MRNIFGVTKGRYLLPAGRVNIGELPDVAAARETFEETNLRVEIEGLIGLRIWVMDDGEHNYFFMFRARLLSPLSDLQPNTNEIDDARFFSREEMDALFPPCFICYHAILPFMNILMGMSFWIAR